MPTLTLDKCIAIGREVTRTVLDGPVHRGPLDAGRQVLAATAAAAIARFCDDETRARAMTEAAMRRALAAVKTGLSSDRPDPGAVAALLPWCFGLEEDAAVQRERAMVVSVDVDLDLGTDAGWETSLAEVRANALPPTASDPQEDATPTEPEVSTDPETAPPMETPAEPAPTDTTPSPTVAPVLDQPPADRPARTPRRAPK